jgi:hypothetical protein
MRLSMSKILLFTSLLLLTVSCKKNSYSNENKEILFQYEYINYAWGYQHNGFIIDNQGNVLTYSNPENWNFTDKDQILTEEQVLKNISLCAHSGKKISEQELQKFSSYIKNISSSQVTAMKNVAADAGTAEFVCYLFSESTRSYKRYLIKMEGDFTCENLNFYSKKVVSWMKDINTSLVVN